MNIQDRSVSLYLGILREDYYVNLFRSVLNKNLMTETGIREAMYIDDKLISMWNDFWIALPDCKEIRRTPFFELCDIAEEIYNDEI